MLPGRKSDLSLLHGMDPGGPFIEREKHQLYLFIVDASFILN
jgi:hypothetical protein